MITDQQRREVAARLREAETDMVVLRARLEEEALDFYCYDQVDYYQIYEAVFGEMYPPDNMHPADYEELHNLLADLVDRPTCTNEAEAPQDFRCGRCGAEYYDVYAVRYCPACGAEVVG